jgi:hypothetical protein
MPQRIRAQRRASLGREQALGMCGAVMRRHVAVLGLDQHVAVLIDENRAEGMIAMGDGAARDIERAAQKMFVELGRA